MKLLSIHVENFGKLSRYDLDLSERLTDLSYPNGWGKTTLAAFIKAMFYGLPASKKTSLDENERKKYAPWQGGAYGGSVVFETARSRYRAERFFGGKERDDHFALYDAKTNRESNDYSEDLGRELFGIDAEGFERSAFVSQRSISFQSGNAGITARLGALLDNVDDIDTFDRAIKVLDEKRKFYELKGGKGAVADTEKEMIYRQERLNECNRNASLLTELRDGQAELEKAGKALEREQAEIGEKIKAAGLLRERRALNDQKNHMIEELNELRRQRSEIETFFEGSVPTEVEVNSAKALWDRLREAKAKRNAISKEPIGGDRLNRYQTVFANGVPDSSLLSEMESKNTELRSKVGDVRRLTESLRISEQNLPAVNCSKESVDKAIDAWNRSAEMASGANALQTSERSKGVLSFVVSGIVALLAGVALSALSFLLAEPPLSTVLLACGIATIPVAAILFSIAVLRAGKRKKAGAGAGQIRELLERSKNEAERVKAFLRACGAEDSEPSASLQRLSLEIEQREKIRFQNRGQEEKIRILQRECGEIREVLQAFLQCFFETIPLKDDYGQDLDRLNRAIDEFSRMKADEANRQRNLAEAETVCRQLLDLLQSFLTKYDPQGSMTAPECLDIVARKREEHRRLCGEIANKEVTLRRFLVEKKPDDVVLASGEDYDTLTRRFDELQAKRKESAEQLVAIQEQIRQKQDIVDRIPEIKEEITRLRERWEIYQENRDTINTTQEFLKAAKESLSTRYLGGMQKSFSRFLKELVGDDSLPSQIDTDFEVRLQEAGATRTMESFSRGWRDAVQFCLRLSLVEALYAKEEKPFLLLDDPFVNLDDVRSSAAKRLVRRLSEEYQILYFRCRSEKTEAPV